MKIGDMVTAIAKPQIDGRAPYSGKLVFLTENVAEIHGRMFEVRPFSRKLWEIMPYEKAQAQYRAAKKIAAERHAAVESFDAQYLDSQARGIARDQREGN